MAFGPDTTNARVGGFDPAFFEKLVTLEPGNYWFEVRNELIVWALGTEFPDACSFLEVGCGTGFVLAGIRRAAPRLRLVGTELQSEGLEFARERVADAELVEIDAREIPYKSEFDAAGAFDVLEHIDEDERVLAELHAALRPQGGLLITVPQHPSLWSPVDEAAGHLRRYTRKELADKVRRAGFEIKRVTSFVSLLLPLMALSRFVKRRRDLATSSELKIGPTANTMLTRVLRLEFGLIRLGISFPAGGSLLLVAKKK